MSYGGKRITHNFGEVNYKKLIFNIISAIFYNAHLIMSNSL